MKYLKFMANNKSMQNLFYKCIQRLHLARKDVNYKVLLGQYFLDQSNALMSNKQLDEGLEQLFHPFSLIQQLVLPFIYCIKVD